MLDSRINFKNEKFVKENIENWHTEDLISAATTAKDFISLLNIVKSMEKTKSLELLKTRDTPEHWIDLYKAHLIIVQKLSELDPKFTESDSTEQNLFDIILSLAVRGALHEQIDIDPETDGDDLNKIIAEADTPSDFYDEEIEKDEDFCDALEKATLHDVQKVHAKLALILSKNNNSYTLKRSSFKYESVKVQTISFIGKALFPQLNKTKRVISKTPCGTGRGDWVDTPTSYILARLNDILTETKSRLSIKLSEYEDQQQAKKRRRQLINKLMFWKK